MKLVGRYFKGNCLGGDYVVGYVTKRRRGHNWPNRYLFDWIRLDTSRRVTDGYDFYGSWFHRTFKGQLDKGNIEFINKDDAMVELL